MHYIWIAPLILFSYGYLIWEEIGVSTLAGIHILPFFTFFELQPSNNNKENSWIRYILPIGTLKKTYFQVSVPSSSWSRSKGIVVVRWEPAGNSSFIYSIPFFRREIAVRADKRISVMNEILNGIRVIKMYAWEGAFSNVIGELRRLDLDLIRRKWDNFSYEVIKVRANAIFQSLVMGKLFFCFTPPSLQSHYMSFLKDFFHQIREKTKFLSAVHSCD